MPAYYDEAAVQMSGVLKSYECRSDANRWVKLWFCPNCGTTVAATAEYLPGGRAITAGTFDDPNWIKPSRHAYTRSALHWMLLPPDVETFKAMGDQ
jgi:hypothetical protein